MIIMKKKKFSDNFCDERVRKKHLICKSVENVRHSLEIDSRFIARKTEVGKKVKENIRWENENWRWNLRDKQTTITV